MKLYILRRPEGIPVVSEVNGNHAWMLPGVDCPDCRNAWGAIGLAYPAIETPFLESTKKKYCGWPVSPIELEKLSRKVCDANSIPYDQCKPGTHFGRFTGRLTGPVLDFVWYHGWDLFVTAKCVEVLRGNRDCGG